MNIACNQNSASDLPDKMYIDTIILFRPLSVLVSSEAITQSVLSTF